MSDYPAKRTYSTPLAKTALDEQKLRLYAVVPDSKRKASLQVSVIANNIHIVVYTNVEGDQNKGIIRARLDSHTFFAILVALANVIDSGKIIDPEKPDAPGKYPSYRIPAKQIKQGGSFGDPLIDGATVHLARVDDGRIYIAVTDGFATNVQFYFGPTDFHDSWVFNGKPIDLAQLSNIYASSWGRIMNNLVTNVLAIGFVEPEKRDAPNQKFGQQRPSNNSSGSSVDKSWSEGSNDDFPI